MSEESISIEETNKIRISLGLKPIPVPNASKQEEKPTKNDDLSLDDTNKLRISLGLKPIPKESQPVVQSQERSAEEYQDEIRKKERDEKVKQKLELAKSKSAKRKKVSVARGLLDDEEEQEQDTDDWLNNIKKPSNVKKPIKKNKLVKKSSVNDDDVGISGVKVGHSIKDINNLQQEDVILTLKDRSFHDEEDELENESLVKKQKLDKEMSEKLRTNKYKQYDGLEGEEKTLLERYDEELKGDHGESFILNGDTIKVDQPTKTPEEETDSIRKNKRRMEFRLDDDEEEDQDEMENNDYSKAKPIKMKKIKKKSGNSRKKQDHKIDEDGDFDIDQAPKTVMLKDEDNLVSDDFELQNVLALKRLKNQKKRKHLKPEDIAKEIQENKENEMQVDKQAQQSIVIDETTEFLGSIKAKSEEAEEPREPFEPKVLENEQSLDKLEPNSENHVEEPKDEVMEEAETVEAPLEDVREEENINFNGGLGSLLGLLKSKNIIQEKTSEQLENERKSMELKKQLDFEKLKLEIEKRIYEENLRQDSSFQKLSKKERQELLESELEQFKTIQNPEEINSKLKDYKPDVKLKYIDEYGREMNTKEAYKQLSHQFHGKAPNKSKIAKKLKKIEDEQKQQYKGNSILGSNDQDEYGSSDKVGVRLQ
ncbi:Midasin [Wickerhamomyces ciferrii]|uniref:Midasin n=1 Tax=Wickerhamomyces ciferrii (strain ATCC 14091 / BCRC 22168 / CBS 111 / JCM 3599 / NBRC 0793 / NRRL Y-1031 F-60-10) TaxID=1206466 RepID=K0KKB9_WICCF|nr:Midasin [Wickerhamomyces ciferrii]CCH43396.1 Midasin [Wickerhamomyces ciferrii]